MPRSSMRRQYTDIKNRRSFEIRSNRCSKTKPIEFRSSSFATKRLRIDYSEWQRNFANHILPHVYRRRLDRDGRIFRSRADALVTLRLSRSSKS